MGSLMLLTRLFPVWATILSIVAYIQPTLFIPFKSYIIPLLSMVMLGMGLTLTFRDFRVVLTQKRAVALGVALQFLIMPLLAFLLSKMMGLSDDLTIGMVMVGSVAGGTASNVICFLAKGNVPLSIIMTSISTLLGVFITPVLVGFFGHKVVDVPVLSMLLSLIKIVLLPVAIGV